MTVCERCGYSGGANHSLQVELDDRNVQLAQFMLCEDCYRYGEHIEPIARITAFLKPSHTIVVDMNHAPFAPTIYYIRDNKTEECIKNARGQPWWTEYLYVAQDKLEEVSE